MKHIDLQEKSQLTDSHFYEQVGDFLDSSKQFAKKQLDTTIAVTYYEVGRMIVEREQEGKKRAKYGSQLLEGLSNYLNERYGKGYSIANLRGMRKFYQVYMPQIQQTVSAEFKNHSLINDSNDVVQKQQTVSAEFKNHSLMNDFNTIVQKQQTVSAEFKLSWSHYQILMRIDNANERKFYEIEAINLTWGVRELRRQVNSSLYERLALSRDKDKVLELAYSGQVMDNPKNMFKTPYILEFTGLEEHPTYSETELEQALIDNLQKFLLELGKGFLFEARQKRFSFDEKSFYVDLVCYNRLLQCYVIIDLKVDELKHQDLGQLMMYVNYFDRYVKTEKEAPTVGILLCKKKNDSIVELTLPKDSNIYASEYSLYLPDKEVLRKKLAEWVEEFEETRMDCTHGKHSDPLKP